MGNSGVEIMSRFFNIFISGAITAIMFLLLTLSSCSTQENDFHNGLGRINIHVTAPEEAADAPILLRLMSADSIYSHTWSDISKFPNYESYHSGSYIAQAIIGEEGAEGYDCPTYIGIQEFEVTDGNTTEVNINCELSQAIVTASESNNSSQYSIESITLHSAGNRYIELQRRSSKPVYLMPGTTSIGICVRNDEGKQITVMPPKEIETKAGCHYDINVNIDDTGHLLIKCGEEETQIILDLDYFNTTPPSITTSGFDAAGVLELTEGFPSENPILMHIASSLPIESMHLTIFSSQPGYNGLPSECDLAGNCQTLIDKGLVIHWYSDNDVTVNFTALIEALRVGSNSDYTFILQCRDSIGRVSNTVSLKIKIQGVELKVKGVTDAEIGVNIASVTLDINVYQVETKDFDVYHYDDNITTSEPLKIEDAVFDESNHTVTLTFKVPEGISDVNLKIDYMGVPKVYTVVHRIVGKYDIKVDSFATWMRIQIDAPTRDIISALTRFANITVPKVDVAVLIRDEENGIITCSGLDPSTRYTVTSSIIPGQYEAKAQFTTEDASRIPDGDFEDAVESIKYSNLASGGIYSSTTFPIFNRQNYVDVDEWFPKKYWASINAKTFCRNASNHNTWYMKPSTVIDMTQSVSGSKSIKLTSVGWSLDGPEIKPYIQEENKYQPYSGNIPAIDNKSAGYLFLGSYSFDPANNNESYVEGITFGSRPSSLNGFYKYMPDAYSISDRGWVKVEIISVGSEGTETLIAHGYMEFGQSPDFKTFNLPLTYVVYNLKANKVKIMFCSSRYSEGLSFDDPLVPVSANVPEANYTGSSLWIDNLSFSY